MCEGDKALVLHSLSSGSSLQASLKSLPISSPSLSFSFPPPPIAHGPLMLVRLPKVSTKRSCVSRRLPCSQQRQAQPQASLSPSPDPAARLCVVAVLLMAGYLSKTLKDCLCLLNLLAFSFFHSPDGKRGERPIALIHVCASSPVDQGRRQWCSQAGT